MMKYLRTFNEGEKDDYYIYIGNSTMGNNPIWKYYDTISISEYNFDWIESLLKRGNKNKPSTYYVNHILYGHKGGLENMDIELGKDYPTYDVYIYELKDEYFIVQINKVFHTDQDIYKCDQLDGVKELFIDKGIIKE